MSTQVFMGRYEVLGKLGQGGMGQVYLARQRDRNRLVVVKVMRPEIATQPKVRESFKREMQFMARFRHPFVVQLLEASLDDPQGPCIIMEHIDGMALDELLKKERRLNPVRVGRILAQLGLALEAANARGIIHRDLKPANVMVIDSGTALERIKVMDFGLAKLSAKPEFALEKLSGSDIHFAQGTPQFMAPEQVRGDDVDHRSDLYSVGCMLFEMLTGKMPFDRPDIMDILDAQTDEPPPTFLKMGASGLERRVEPVVQRCLAKFPNERPQTARELIQLYERHLGEPLLAEAEMLAKELPVDDSETAPPVPEETQVPRLDPNTVVHHLHAWMPERIAVVKLRGFVEDAGGEVVESVPGMIRVSLGGPRCAYRLPPELVGSSGLLGLFKLTRKVHPGIDMELHMEKRQGDPGNQLDITILLKPVAQNLTSAQLSRNPAWQELCEKVYKDLRSYLMGRGG